MTFQILPLNDDLKKSEFKKSIVKQWFKYLKKQKLECNIGERECSNGVAPPRKLFSHITKKQATDEDWMSNSNNDNLCLKCYINLFNIVPDGMEGF